MRLNKLLPLICLTLILPRNGFTQTPPPSPENSANASGIEPGKSYPGAALLALMEAAEEEIDGAAKEAYAEGYKAAVSRYAPDAAVYKDIAENLTAALEAERRRGRYFWPALGAAAGAAFLGGFLCSFFMLR